MICPRCKTEAGDANYCPNCGTDLTRVGRVQPNEGGSRVIYNRNAPQPKRHGCLIVILTVLFLFLVFCFLLFIFTPRPEPPYMEDVWEDPSYEDSEPPPEGDLVTITMDEYKQIEIGMTYDEVREIVGGDGENVSSADLWLDDASIMEIYSWNGAGDGYGSATIIVQDGTVISKFQSELE